jgi:hypothetical protein
LVFNRRLNPQCLHSGGTRQRGGTIELLSSSEPHRLEDGRIKGDWIDDPRHGHLLHLNPDHVAAITVRHLKSGKGAA